MIFNSSVFIIFLCAVVGFRIIAGRTKTEAYYLKFLLFCSLLFYTWHIPVYLSIILVSAIVDYIAGRLLSRTGFSSVKRKSILVLSLIANLGILFFFKYYNFFTSGVNRLLSVIHAPVIPHLELILPMGISFYTFQSMSYSIDVYRGKVKTVDHFWKFLLYVSFFPQLTAGPIVRAKEFLYQLARKRGIHVSVLMEGLYLIIRGYFLKLVIADNLGIYVTAGWGKCTVPQGDALNSLLIVVFFSVQIFADFAGYSSIARGIAYILGFKIPVNFRSPYIAGSFREFWMRWHITLSQWLKDYLYVSLGGNRRGAVRTYINILIVMLLGGLWHGASTTFIFWGLIHGIALIIERLLKMENVRNQPAIWKKALWFIVTQATVLIAWTFFRADNFAQAWTLLGNIIQMDHVPGHFLVPWKKGLLLTLPVIIMHLRTLMQDRLRFPAVRWYEKAVYAGVMMFGVSACWGMYNEFIYFQF